MLHSSGKNSDFLQKPQFSTTREQQRLGNDQASKTICQDAAFSKKLQNFFRLSGPTTPRRRIVLPLIVEAQEALQIFFQTGYTEQECDPGMAFGW
jgi:hypothetical protein